MLLVHGKIGKCTTHSVGNTSQNLFMSARLGTYDGSYERPALYGCGSITVTFLCIEVFSSGVDVNKRTVTTHTYTLLSG